jgi:succinate dehydrogenase/fumarate reductase cytochrome b subunit
MGIRTFLKRADKAVETTRHSVTATAATAVVALVVALVAVIVAVVMKR